MILTSMKSFELTALQFWNAAKFYRRAPGRDQAMAMKVLRHAARSEFKTIRQRAKEILKGLPDDECSRED